MFLRGNGGVSHKSLQSYVHRLTDISTDMVVGIKLDLFYISLSTTSDGVTSKTTWMQYWGALPFIMSHG